MRFERIEPGMVLYDIHRQKMGNTTMRHWVLYEVRVISVDRESRAAVCSWNGYTPRLYFKNELESLKTRPSKAYLEQQERRKNGFLL